MTVEDRLAVAEQRIAELEALIRQAQTPQVARLRTGTWRFNGLTLDTTSHRIITRTGDVVDLTGNEARLLRLMIEAPEGTVSREEISTKILRKTIVGRNVDQLVHHLRVKLNTASNGEIRILSVRAFGYALSTPVSDEQPPLPSNVPSADVVERLKELLEGALGAIKAPAQHAA